MTFQHTSVIPAKGKSVCRIQLENVPVNCSTHSLVKKMLVVDASQRISLDEVVHHPWLHIVSTSFPVVRPHPTGDPSPVESRGSDVTSPTGSG